MNRKIKVVHLIYRFDIGGLEKVMSECINHLPDYYEHVVISLTEATPYAKNVLNEEIKIICLHKKEGNDISLYWKLFSLLRELSPDVLHTYSLPTLEYQILGFFAGIKTRIHAEHGWDISDTEGKNKKYKLLRRIINPFVQKWVAVSKDIRQWLINDINIDSQKVRLIYNGVDTEQFRPEKQTTSIYDEKTVIGTIGRFDPIKNHKSLIHVFKYLKENNLADDLVIAIIGNGPEYNKFQEKIQTEGLQDYFWLPGARYDIAELLNNFDIFVLPSIAEGVPMTLLEAMSTALPVVCTRVGGIPEVLDEGSGIMVESGDTESLTQAILKLLKQKDLAAQYGKHARNRVIEHFSVMSMVNQYQTLYEA